jgi:hypothetical protein
MEGRSMIMILAPLPKKWRSLALPPAL